MPRAGRVSAEDAADEGRKPAGPAKGTGAQTQSRREPHVAPSSRNPDVARPDAHAYSPFIRRLISEICSTQLRRSRCSRLMISSWDHLKW
jgi:hypothetical protein